MNLCLPHLYSWFSFVASLFLVTQHVHNQPAVTATNDIINRPTAAPNTGVALYVTGTMVASEGQIVSTVSVVASITCVMVPAVRVHGIWAYL